MGSTIVLLDLGIIKKFCTQESPRTSGCCVCAADFAQGDFRLVVEDAVLVMGVNWKCAPDLDWNLDKFTWSGLLGL
jgi:hypothetical protein